MEKFVITCMLPINKVDDRGDWIIENGSPVYETDLKGNLKYAENFFCGFQPVDGNNSLQALEWDTEIQYALLFESRTKAKQVAKKIETGEPLTIREVEPKDLIDKFKYSNQFENNDDK